MKLKGALTLALFALLIIDLAGKCQWGHLQYWSLNAVIGQLELIYFMVLDSFAFLLKTLKISKCEDEMPHFNFILGKWNSSI